ncbi:hypothetical protein OCU04_005652 [Sclerotinia nivalis]|uniref:Uncharacterized protein n=1 Tax=Sclerotinia nivalis TaxID=352851 RepID=A0A9X0APK0_9HELO|nr:hypothetical protein OCU04_005652 [Sclerotinia nivalis]
MAKVPYQIPKDMREEYQDKIAHQRYLLTVLRPFYGHNATGPDVNKLSPREIRELLKINKNGDGTYGIDAFLTVLRMVLQHARTLDLPPNATSNEKMFEKMAWKTMGWIRMDDYLMKEEIIKKLLNTDSVTEDTMKAVDLTFEALYNRDDLKNLLKENKLLQAISRVYVTRPKDKDDSIWENRIINPEELRRMNDLKTDEEVVLEKEDGGLPVLVAKQDYVYQLAASIRLSGERYDKEGMKVVDDVRTYWIDGQPIDTRNVGIEGHQKEIHMETEYKEAGNKRWSIGEPGRYLLLYVIVILADGAPKSVLDKKFPEFIPMFEEELAQDDQTTQPERSDKVSFDTNTRVHRYIVPDPESDEELEFPIREGDNPSKPVIKPQEKSSESREPAERAPVERAVVENPQLESPTSGRDYITTGPRRSSTPIPPPGDRISNIRGQGQQRRGTHRELEHNQRDLSRGSMQSSSYGTGQEPRGPII